MNSLASVTGGLVAWKGETALCLCLQDRFTPGRQLTSLSKCRCREASECHSIIQNSTSRTTAHCPIRTYIRTVTRKCSRALRHVTRPIDVEPRARFWLKNLNSGYHFDYIDKKRNFIKLKKKKNRKNQGVSAAKRSRRKHSSFY